MNLQHKARSDQDQLPPSAWRPIGSITAVLAAQVERDRLAATREAEDRFVPEAWAAE